MLLVATSLALVTPSILLRILTGCSLKWYHVIKWCIIYTQCRYEAIINILQYLVLLRKYRYILQHCNMSSLNVVSIQSLHSKNHQTPVIWNNITCFIFLLIIWQGWRKVFVTGQVKLNPEHYSINYVGRMIFCQLQYNVISLIGLKIRIPCEYNNTIIWIHGQPISCNSWYAFSIYDSLI